MGEWGTGGQVSGRHVAGLLKLGAHMWVPCRAPPHRNLHANTTCPPIVPRSPSPNLVLLILLLAQHLLLQPRQLLPLRGALSIRGRQGSLQLRHPTVHGGWWRG